MLRPDFQAYKAVLTLPLLGEGITVTVAPMSSTAYMRLVFAQCEARLMMWGDFSADTTETMTRELSSSWRGDLMEEWMPSMVESKRSGYPEAL